MLNFKCLLQPHSNIPPPVLAILVGRLPTAVTPPIQDGVIEETNEEEGRSGESWEEAWGWGDEEDTKTSNLARSTTNEKRLHSSPVSSHPAGPTTEPYMISPSGDGIHMVLAHNTKFLVLRMHEEENQLVAVGQGSGCEDVGETITAILCLPLFVPSIRKRFVSMPVHWLD
ncbi:hypothetical protein BC937DRAFT_86885 [Endogone sp. FLAS-F59071]|nr:hypothetical protein BC937DRAFT_86885 [Endogone sp. FLAS-F59071]|eukprot:RUS12843.1 hypothetical protein BC937DRAFT_86885 [Endogone sp. FLAS-F59071]